MSVQPGSMRGLGALFCEHAILVWRQRLERRAQPRQRREALVHDAEELQPSALRAEC